MCMYTEVLEGFPNQSYANPEPEAFTLPASLC